MEILTSAVMCLALNIYNEARGEPLEGQYAVAQVTMNRVADDRWADTVCGVVYEKYQFSWTLKKFAVRDEHALDEAIRISANVLKGEDYYKPIQCANHYYNYHIVNPDWAKDMTVEVIIGNHIFLCSED